MNWELLAYLAIAVFGIGHLFEISTNISRRVLMDILEEVKDINKTNTEILDVLQQIRDGDYEL